MRLLAGLGLLPLGAALGLAALALHGQWWSLAFAALTTLLTLYAVPRGWGARLPFALGYVGVVGYASNPRPEGDYVIAGDPSGYALIALALAVLVISLGTLTRPTLRRLGGGDGGDGARGAQGARG